MVLLYWIILVEDVTPQRWWASDYNRNETSKQILLRHQAQVYTIRLASDWPRFSSGSGLFKLSWLSNRHCSSSIITEDVFPQMCLWPQHLSWAGQAPCSVGVQFPHPLGAGSPPLPTGLWRRTEQVLLPFKLRTHTTFLAGVQKAAQYWGNKKALAVKEKKVGKKGPRACCCITFTHPLNPQLAFLWQDTLSPAPYWKKKKKFLH